MKKLMKAIAFATVMCMLLSTSAFAAATLTTTDYVLDVEVTTASGDEQVALLIVDTGATLASLSDDDILYVGQMAATAGTADFGEISINTSTESTQVDVYAGYASNSALTAYTVAQDVDLKNVQALKVSLDGKATIILNVEQAEGFDAATMGTTDNDIGSLVILPVKFENVPTGASVTKMFWAFGIDTNGDAAAEDYKYVEGNVANLVLGSICDGAVQLGAAFNNGTKANNGADALNVVSANAIFLIGGQTHHTATGDELTAIEADDTSATK